MRKYVTLDICLALIMILFIVFFMYDGVFVSELPSDSWTFPGFIFAMVILLSICDIIKSIIAVRKTEDACSGSELFKNKKNFYVICALILLYLALFFIFDFVTASMIFAVLYCLYTKYPRKKLFFLYIFISIPLVYVLFSKFLGVSFSAGVVWKLFKPLFPSLF